MNNFPYFKGRINRRDFILGMFFFNFLYFLIFITPYLFLFQKYSFQEIKSMSKINLTIEVGNFFSIYSASGIFFNICGLFIILASIGICVRRFHDIGRVGRLAFLIPLAFIFRMFFAHMINYLLTNSIVPSHSDVMLFKFSDYFSIIAGLIVTYLTLQKGQEHKNQYGEVPVNSKLKKIIFN